MSRFHRIPGAALSGRVASSVGAITLDANSNYASGGIPFGTAVVEDTTGATPDVVVQAATGGRILGIAASDPAAGPGEAILIETAGVVKCLAGGVIAYGDQVYVGDASGRVITVPGVPAAGTYSVGIAEGVAVAAGDLVSVRIERVKLA